MTHPFKDQAKSGQTLAKSRYADGGAVKDILTKQQASNDASDSRNFFGAGPTPENLRNKQWTDATDPVGKGSRYGNSFIGKKSIKED